MITFLSLTNTFLLPIPLHRIDITTHDKRIHLAPAYLSKFSSVTFLCTIILLLVINVIENTNIYYLKVILVCSVTISLCGQPTIPLKSIFHISLINTPY